MKTSFLATIAIILVISSIAGATFPKKKKKCVKKPPTPYPESIEATEPNETVDPTEPEGMETTPEIDDPGTPKPEGVNETSPETVPTPELEPVSTTQLPSKSTDSIFHKLEEAFKDVQGALRWFMGITAKEGDQALRHQLQAFQTMLKDEMNPIMRKMHIDAVIIGSQSELKEHIGRRKVTKGGILLNGLKALRATDREFGAVLRELENNLNSIVKDEGLLEEIKINEQRLRECIKEMRSVYYGEWERLLQNIEKRVRKIADKPKNQEELPSSATNGIFSKLEDAFKEVQSAVEWFMINIREGDQALGHQMVAFVTMLKDEMNPVLKKMHVDAWIIGKNMDIGRRKRTQGDVLLDGLKALRAADQEFGRVLRELENNLDSIVNSEGLLEKLKINEQRLRKGIRDVRRVYYGEWGRLLRNIEDRVRKIANLPQNQEELPSSATPGIFDGLKKAFQQVQSVARFFVLQGRRVNDKVLEHQVEAFVTMLKDEMNPIMAKMHVDAWIVGKQSKMHDYLGRRKASPTGKGILIWMRKRFAEAHTGFGRALYNLKRNLKRLVRNEGLLQKLRVNEQRLQDSIREAGSVYGGEWNRLFWNIMRRIDRLVDAAPENGNRIDKEVDVIPQGRSSVAPPS